MTLSGMSMAYRIEITARAEQDLAVIYRNIEAATSPQAAKWFNGMAKAMSSLDAYPNRNPVIPEDRASRHLLYGKKPYVYRIIYEVDEETSTVYITHIRAPGRDRMEKP